MERLWGEADAAALTTAEASPGGEERRDQAAGSGRSVDTLTLVHFLYQEAPCRSRPGSDGWLLSPLPPYR
jgi:hypothetical protein